MASHSLAASSRRSRTTPMRSPARSMTRCCGSWSPLTSVRGTSSLNAAAHWRRSRRSSSSGRRSRRSSSRLCSTARPRKRSSARRRSPQSCPRLRHPPPAVQVGRRRGRCLVRGLQAAQPRCAPTASSRAWLRPRSLMCWRTLRSLRPCQARRYARRGAGICAAPGCVLARSCAGAHFARCVLARHGVTLVPRCLRFASWG